MKKAILAIGLVLIIFSALGYKFGPDFANKEISNLTGGTMNTSMTSSMLSQMGIPPIDEMVEITKYSFVGLGVAGIGVTIFGIISKKSKPQFVAPKSEFVHKVEPEEIKGKTNPLHYLQERLARGEITSSQYKNLKKLLEEDDKKIM